jgi:hypothetical protein
MFCSSAAFSGVADTITAFTKSSAEPVTGTCRRFNSAITPVCAWRMRTDCARAAALCNPVRDCAIRTTGSSFKTSTYSAERGRGWP